jgi:hypothetical protein
MRKMREVSSQDLLPVVHTILRRRYGELTVKTGQGVVKGQRVEFSDEGRPVSCVIKTSMGGRISFGRRTDRTWSGLSESERVIVVAPTKLHGADQMVSMFDQKVLLDAFEANRAAQEKAGMGHLPNWIAPFHEEGRGARGIGDDFGDKAIWIEPLDMKPMPSSSLEVTRVEPVPPLTIAEAKEGLAKRFGVSPEAIEITIRG